MESSFDQEIRNFDMINENFSGLTAIEQDVEHNESLPHLPVALETEQRKQSNAVTPDIENALSLIIKVEPEMNDYESVEAAKNVYSHECIKQEYELIVQSRNNVIKRERTLNIDNLNLVPDTFNKEKGQPVVHLETVTVIKKDENVVIDKLHHLSDSAVKDFSIREEPLMKIEPNEAKNCFEEMQEIDFKDWKIKDEGLDIKDLDLEERGTSIVRDCGDPDNKGERFASEESDHCRHRTVRKSDLLECIKCSSQSGYKQILKTHVRDQEIEIFECNKCDFQTKHKYNLKAHLLRHNNCEDAKKFKCDQCVFQTKHKHSLKAHLLRHNNCEDAKMFKCDHCSYRCILKPNLKRHLLLHRNPEDVEMLKCNKCDFQTNRKDSLNNHLLRHNDPDDVKTFKCDQCSYKTFLKYQLKRHLLRHGNPKNVEMFKCTECDFQTIHKYSLTIHLIRHNKSDDVKKFKSGQCYYRSIKKSNSKKHLIIQHINPENVEIFKCDKCDFQTKYKSSFTLHLLLHNNSDDVKKM